MKKEIKVPFEKKSKAREIGIEFDKSTRKWIGTEELEKQLNLYVPTEDKVKKIEQVIEDKEITQIINITTKETVGINWENLIKNEHTLVIASAIQKYGLPEDSEIRAKILMKLSYRVEEEYPISYDGMMKIRIFAERYPEEYLYGLVQRCITGKNPYEYEIQHSDLSNEEKALLLFALPLE